MSGYDCGSQMREGELQGPLVPLRATVEREIGQCDVESIAPLHWPVPHDLSDYHCSSIEWLAMHADEICMLSMAGDKSGLGAESGSQAEESGREFPSPAGSHQEQRQLMLQKTETIATSRKKIIQLPALQASHAASNATLRKNVAVTAASAVRW